MIFNILLFPVLMNNKSCKECGNDHMIRTRPSQMVCKMSVLKNFAKFTGKQLRRSLFYNKVAG